MTSRQEQRREAICALYKSGEKVKVIAERYGVNSPAIWKLLRRAGVVAPYGKRDTPRGRRLNPTPPLTPEQRATIRPRDPCPRCGVRAEIGCSHAHARLSSAVVMRAW